MKLMGGNAARIEVLVREWCLILAFFPMALAAQAANVAAVVTTIKEYCETSFDSGKPTRPVRIEATATYVDPEWKILVVQDATAGGQVLSPSQHLGIETGDRIVMEGMLTRRIVTNYIHEIHDVTLRKIGAGELPMAVSAGAQELFTPTFDGRLVKARGVVRSVMELGRLQLVLVLEDARIPVWVHHYQPSDLKGLLDAQITIEGICNLTIGTETNKTANLLVSDIKSLHIDRAGPADPYAIDTTAIGKITGGQVDLTAPQRVKIEGEVTQQELGKSLQVDDGTGRVTVRTTQLTPLARNERIRVIGFPARVLGEIVLEDSQFHRIQTPVTPQVIAAQANPALPILTNLKQVLELTREQARQHYPVRATGVVIHHDPQWKQLFIQEGDQAIYVDLGNQSVDLKTGRRVEVSGVTVPGGVLTMISPVRFEDRGEAPLPEAATVTYNSALTGEFDARRVRVKGIVQSMTVEDNHLLLDLAVADGRFYCTVPELAGSSLKTNLVDALVEVTGVCVLNIDALGSPTGVTLAADGERDVIIVDKAPKNALEIPTQRIGDVLGFLPPKVASRRLKVQGSVSLWRPGREVYIEDATGAIRALTTLTNDLSLGDEVEIIGYRTPGEITPILRYAEYQTVRHGTGLAPRLLRPADVLNITNHGTLLRLEGRLIKDVPASPEPELLLEQDDFLFTVAVEPQASGQALPAWRAGSKLSVTGVCLLRVDELRKPREFRLLARSLPDVEVLELPPWYASRHFVTIAIVLLVVLVLALVWIVVLRRMVSQQTQLIRRRLESEAATERRLALVWETSADGMRMTDGDGVVVQVNQAYCLMVRKGRADLTGQPFATAYQSTEQASMQAQYRDAFARRTFVPRQEAEITLWNGDLVWLEQVNVFFEQPDFPPLLLSQFRDITQRMRAEDDLRRSEERYRSMVQNSPMGMHLYELRADGRLIFIGANPAADRLLGVDNRQFVGLDIETAFPALKNTDVPQHYRLAARDGVPWHTEQVDYHEGEIHGAFEVHAFQISPGKIVSLFLDITERKRADAERERLQAQLMQSQKMESVGRLAGGVAHDFNNMLQVILGNTQLALDKTTPAERLHEELLEIQKSAERSADLTRQLLAFARKQTINPEVLDLNDKVTGMIKMLQRLIGENLQLAWIPAMDLWPVKMDPGQIDQILFNLSLNARDAIDGSGRITIETSNVSLDHTYAREHPDCVPGDYVMLAVGDTGRGLDAVAREHLFEPFFTTKEIGKGTGLGLATVFGIVKQNRGLINVYSEPDRGTIFKIYLPRAASAPPAPSSAGPRPDLHGTETILLVEDEKQILDLGQRILTKHGYTVLAAQSCEAALEVATRHSGRVHLLITDVIMPGMNGKELKRRMDNLKPGIRCIFVSGYTANVIAHHGVLDEGVHFLQKPFTVGTLTEKVRRVLED
jgi:PAS domain S-box-containing protein